VEWVEACLKAAKVVLQVMAEEYGRLKLPTQRFREIMEAGVESAVDSLGLPERYTDELSTEFVTLAGTKEPQRVALRIPLPVGAPPGITSPAAARRVQAYIDKSPLRRADLMARAQISERTLSTVLNTHKVSESTWRVIAKAMRISFDDLLAD
jgi:hypothetical protein